MNKINRVIVLVLDSAGIGYLPDAAEFGDEGANTLKHTAESVNGLNVPHMQKMGLGNIAPIPGVEPANEPTAAYGKMKEASRSKDTMAGHWEMMGLIVDKPFPVFPEGFPQEILDEFYKATGVKAVLGNKAASGTEIIQELGDEHLLTGYPILYTSADSVFQIAAHEAVIPLDALYRMCEQSRGVCDAHHIGRVIARPFVGESDNYTRTANRKDYPMDPSGPTALDVLKEKDFPVMGIGKIEDIFAGKGITRAVHTRNNHHGMECLTAELEITQNGLIFVNLVDFDMLYGHRNNAEGYAQALEAFDEELGRLLPLLKEDDLLIISADHGCDPTYPGTDHTREYVPILAQSKHLEARDLGVRETFADIGATILKLFGLSNPFAGQSLIEDNINENLNENLNESLDENKNGK